MAVRTLVVLLILAPLGLVAGCGQRSNLVYVLDGPQSVTLAPSATPQRVAQGDTVILRVERRTSGQWKQIPLAEVQPGQCWMYRPPGELEQEVADSVQWDVMPENAVAFNPEYRFDHTKVATARVKGTITLTPRSAVKCEADRVVEGPSIQIEVS